MGDKWEARIPETEFKIASEVAKAHIYAKHLTIGIGVTIDRNATIGTPTNPCERVHLGDHVFIGANTYIESPDVSIGDYTKIHRNTLVYGHNPVILGHNVWVGEGSIIDAEGHTAIGNNVGIGAHSQLWSHIRHGDTLMGCKYLSHGVLDIHNDVWFVGHCVVNPIVAMPFSMAMVGSVVTKTMESNHIYAGVPAVDVTSKLGTPYIFPDSLTRLEMLRKKCAEFYEIYSKTALCSLEHLGRLTILDCSARDAEGLPVFTAEQVNDPDETFFDVHSRTYTKKRTVLEIAFMKFLLPEAKFIPII